jgi:Zn-dependent peptidase ImmA (M78 family)
VDSPARKAGRTKARRLREAHGIAPDVPLPDVLALAEAQENVSVLIFEHLADGVDGLYTCRGSERLILLNGSFHVRRLRFTLAHELCHHCFGDDLPELYREVRASAFAGELLVPQAAVAKWLRECKVERADLYDVVDLALRFGVSAEMAHRRLDDCEVPVAHRAVREGIEAGRHLAIAAHADPYDDSLQEAVENLPRVPERFRTSVFFRVALGELRMREGAARLGCSAEQLRSALLDLGVLPPA